MLNLVFAAPPGERLDTAERKAAVEDAIAELKSEHKPTEDTAGIESVGDPFDDATFSDDGRIAYAEAQFDRVIYTKDREAVVEVQDAVGRRSRPPASRSSSTATPSSRRSSRDMELLGLFAALIVLLIVFRTFVASAIPILLALTALATASSCSSSSPASPTSTRSRRCSCR